MLLSIGPDAGSTCKTRRTLKSAQKLKLDDFFPKKFTIGKNLPRPIKVQYADQGTKIYQD
jgi:hypothetical protein